MKLVVPLVVSSLTFAGAAVAFQEKPAKPPADETPLAREMEKVDQAMQFLRRSIKDAAQDEKSLEQVAIAEQACLASKLLPPKMAPHVAEAERKAFLKDYRKGVAALLAEWLRLETALLDGDRGAALESWKKLDDMEEKGHETFTEGD